MVDENAVQPDQSDPSVVPVLIIGAGPAGLAAAAELRQHRVASLLVERSNEIASSWRNRYDSLRLNTCRWNSTLRVGDRYEQGTPFFPLRQQAVNYLESFAAEHEVNIRFGVQVEQINPVAEGWEVSTATGPIVARQVVVASGHQHTPRLPNWLGREDFKGQVIHSWDYRNPSEFQGLDVLVVGGGCSGLDIARDLAQGGAKNVRVAVRTHPNLLRKKSFGLPTDLLAAALHRVPVRIADAIGRLIQRVTIGDLSNRGLSWPKQGIFTGLHGDGSPPVIVGDEVIDAIKNGDFEIVAGVSAVNADGVKLEDGTQVQPDVIVAATGYTTGLTSMVGHLGVLDENGRPLNYRQPAIKPGLHFMGYAPCMGVIGRDAKRVMRHVLAERSV